MVSHAHLYRKTWHPRLWSAKASADETPYVPWRPSSWPDDSRPTGFFDKAASILDDICRAMERNPEDAREAALRLVMLLTPTADVDSANARGGLAPWQRRKVDRYARLHLQHTLRVDELAQQISLSVSHFCRAFKESFGDTPHEYIIRLRLKLAQKLMLSTEDPLSQIALACGFADQAHLSKTFRRLVGETPAAWRRRNLTEAQAEARSRRATESRETIEQPRAISIDDRSSRSFDPLFVAGCCGQIERVNDVRSIAITEEQFTKVVGSQRVRV